MPPEDWHKRGARIEELQSQVETVSARTEELAREILDARTSLAKANRQASRLEEDWRKRGLRIEELQRKLGIDAAKKERLAQTVSEKDLIIRELENRVASSRAEPGDRQEQ